MTSIENSVDSGQAPTSSLEGNEAQHISDRELLRRIQVQPSQTDILVDFDETLLLENSTESYLNSLQPRILGYLFLSSLNLLRPWNWMPGPLRGTVSRDWLRIVLSTLFFPWTPLLWKIKAQAFARTKVNRELLDALSQRSDCDITVASLGFQFIIRPLVAQLQLPTKHIVACRFWRGGQDRHRGKLAMVQQVLDDRAIAKSMLITDSKDDACLLDVVDNPCLFVWPEARYIPAMQDVYIPLFYTAKVKKVGAPFLVREVIGNDFSVLILATSWLSPAPFLHGVSMAFFMLSFLCIYEMGYMENDLLGERFEEKPVLSASYVKYKQKINFWQPWLWSIGFAIAGLLLVQSIDDPSSPILFTDHSFLLSSGNWLTKALPWGIFLVVVRLFFSFYNRIDKYSRVWLYPILQVFKSFSFLLVTSTNLAGAMLFSSTILAYWLPYIIYRYTKDGWPKSDFAQLFRLFSFALLMIAVAFGTQNFSLLMTWQMLAILAYIMFRSATSLLRLVRSAKPVWVDQWGV